MIGLWIVNFKVKSIERLRHRESTRILRSGRRGGASFGRKIRKSVWDVLNLRCLVVHFRPVKGGRFLVWGAAVLQMFIGSPGSPD